MIKAKLKSVLNKALPEKYKKYLMYWSLVRNNRFTYEQDQLYATSHVDFLKEPKFAAAYKKGRDLMMESWGPHQIHWRAYVACWAAKHASHLEGDFVECGVNTGMMARMIVDYLDFQKLDKKFYLVDTYNGLSEKYSTPEEFAAVSSLGYHDIYEEVVNTFKPFPNVKVVKGVVPDILASVPAQKVSFLSIDMNTVVPEEEAMKYYWDKMVSGGIMLMDDHGFDVLQQKAHNKFAASKGVTVLPLPTGQGIIIKP